ncbi:unnamed protein product [Heligmosomoides polygyrus]|uniref:Endo/exonuclease/phosphatase domain-containing protein n=1 Tax=Heligmosomoides polygyrus TaxID=6339 RepID=A0A183G395_HELPZ|nr:unnamed protein product [Heligmosomoides polygyrus]
MSLRLDTKEGYWTIMSVYAPQTGCSERDKDDFYLSLEEAIRSVPEVDYLSIAGDMNGHVESGRRGVERVHGRKEIGLINPDGERILDLAKPTTWLSVAPSSRRGRARRTLKGKLYRTVVRPALLYGSECWALSKAQERQLHAAEMRKLRWACGWTRRDRLRNEDVRAVTVPIQLKMREQTPGKRPRGAARKRWKDVTKKDLAEVGATADEALDRMSWRQITRTADPATAQD